MLVAVYKPEDAPDAPSYWISEGFSNMQAGCTCPDYQKHGMYCKHTLAWEDLQNTEAMVAVFEADYKLIAEAESANGVESLL